MDFERGRKQSHLPIVDSQVARDLAAGTQVGYIQQICDAEYGIGYGLGRRAKIHSQFMTFATISQEKGVVRLLELEFRLLASYMQNKNRHQ